MRVKNRPLTSLKNALFEQIKCRFIMGIDLTHLRKEYHLKELNRAALRDNPFEQFSDWFQEAQQARIDEPNAMVLATASKDGKPSSRTVLLKDVTHDGFVFFSYYNSRKGKELAENPYASVTFLWKELERQISIAGKVKKISRSASARYFASRPRGSQLSVWASQQSQPLTSREDLDQAYRSIEEKYAGQSIPLPPYWGGYSLIASRFEFWQGRSNRLHDRFCYEWHPQSKIWMIQRLYP
jgi:pyridoxamine 5'-phosphate oxidase